MDSHQLYRDEIRELLKYKELVERRRAMNRESAKKHYHRTMKLGEDATIEEIQFQKRRLEKRDAYQKEYYAKNRERIVERQRAYRACVLKKKRAEESSVE